VLLIEPTDAQKDDRVANCTEKLDVDRVHIGHDCGEFASVLIAGNVVIQRSWSRTNRASRAARIRARREGGASAGSTPATTPANGTTPATAPVSAAQNCHPAYDGCVPADHDVSCREIGFQHLPVFNADVDPYNLDAINKPGNGITCDNIG
jgi:hypothetical protein